MGRVEDIRRRMVEILEGSSMITYQYALPAMIDDFMADQRIDEQTMALGRSTLIGTNALLVFASAASVCLMAYIDALEHPGEQEYMDELEKDMAAFEHANSILGQTEEKILGEDYANGN